MIDASRTSRLFENPLRVGPERLVLGGRFGEEPAALSWRRLDHFVGAGGRIVDTAHSYAGGGSERVIGEWLRANPDGVVVVDKIGHPDDNGQLDLSPKRLLAEADESRDRLGVSRIDVVLLHRDSPGVSIEEIADTLNDLVNNGYAECVGVSNWPAKRLVDLADEMADRHLPLIVSYQQSLAVPRTPLWPGSRHVDPDLEGVIESRNLPLLAWAAQARGFFTGTTDLPNPGQGDPFDTAENRARRKRCQMLADDLAMRPETVALAWLLHQPNTWSIVGPRTILELDASLAAGELQLDTGDLRWLAEGIR